MDAAANTYFDYVMIGQRDDRLPRVQVALGLSAITGNDAIWIDVKSEGIQILADRSHEQRRFPLAGAGTPGYGYARDLLSAAEPILSCAEELGRASLAFVAQSVRRPNSQQSTEALLPRVSHLDVDGRLGGTHVTLVMQADRSDVFPGLLTISVCNGQPVALETIGRTDGMVVASEQDRAAWEEIVRLGKQIEELCVPFSLQVANAMEQLRS